MKALFKSVVSIVLELIFFLCYIFQRFIQRSRLQSETISFNSAGQITQAKDERQKRSSSKFKMIQLSDSHYDSCRYKKQRTHWLFHYERTSDALLDSVIDAVVNEAPDLLVITGDLIQYQPETIHGLKVHFFEPLLSRFKPKYGIFVVIGNHDIKLKHSKEMIREVLNSIESVHVLEMDATQKTSHSYGNIRRVIQLERNRRIEFIGLPDYHDVTFHDQYRDIEQMFNDKNQDDSNDTFRVILSHNPDSVRLLLRDNWRFDLVLCGHTHGGQICIPIPFYAEKVRKWLFPSSYCSQKSHPEDKSQLNYRIEILDKSNIIPLHPILIRLYHSLPLTQNMKKSLLKYSLIQKLLCILKYWECGKGLVRLHHKDGLENNGLKYLYTSRGLATHPPLRWFCPPEITTIEIE